MPSRRNDDVEKEFTKDLLSLIKSSITSNQHMNEAIIRLQEQQSSLEDDVSSLLKVVRDGNGRPALLSRLDNLERQVKQECEEGPETNEGEDGHEGQDSSDLVLDKPRSNSKMGIQPQKLADHRQR